MSNLQKEIVSLSADEKFELLDVLWESHRVRGAPNYRRAARRIGPPRCSYDEIPPMSIPWEQVKENLRKTGETSCRWLPEAEYELKEAQAWYQRLNPDLAVREKTWLW